MHGFYFIIVDNDGGDRKECRWVTVMTSLISCGGYCDMKQWWRRYDVQLLEIPLSSNGSPSKQYSRAIQRNRTE